MTVSSMLEVLKNKGDVTDPMLKGALITDTHADRQPKALQSPELLNKREDFCDFKLIVSSGFTRKPIEKR